MHDVVREVTTWKSQIKKGTLELAVLVLLDSERRYGLELVELLNGLDLDISEGSIYPLLSRLRSEKKVTTEWVDSGVGHAHKYYELTAHGRQILRGMVEGWREYTTAFNKLIGDHK
jgi:PadR family transcriptional regulator, regulatory protein PadR